MKNEKKCLAGKMFFGLAVTFLLAVPAFAQDDDSFENYRLEARAVKGSRVSNLDLIRKIFPDAQVKKGEPETATALQAIPLRNLFGGDEKHLDGALSLDITGRRLETLDGRRKILWLLIKVSQPDKPDCDECSKKILAAFDVSPANAELIDAANVLTSFDAEFDGERPKLRIAPRREAVVVWNFSHTSLEGDAFSVVAADKDGFKILLDQFKVGRNYSCDKWYEEETSLRLLKTAAGGGFRGIEILVKTKGGTGWYDFPKVKISRRFRYVFGWQTRGQKYEALVNPETERRALLKRIEPPCPDNQSVPINPT